jgi:hypothetical protein
MEDTSILNPSELGSKEYWDAAYEKEIKNYETNGDPGKKFSFVNKNLNFKKFHVFR